LTHKVKRIFHAASVYGVVGAGYRVIENVAQCVTNALACIDSPPVAAGKYNRSVPEEESILFPVFGIGTTRSDMVTNAGKQVATALAYLRSRAQFTCVKRVYFLSATTAHLTALRVVFTELGVRELAHHEDAPPAPQKTGGAHTRGQSRARKQ
jgi:hypothetical protein